MAIIIEPKLAKLIGPKPVNIRKGDGDWWARQLALMNRINKAALSTNIYVGEGRA